MFFSDLTQEIRHDIEVDFMRVKSYMGKRKQGDIQVTKDLETAIKGKHVYIIDDIYDSGRTMQAVMKYLRVKEPRSLNVVTLLKREQNAVDANEFADNFIYGFEIKGEWVVGYGMDNEKGYCRNYAGIFAV
jgi:hypoxanthine phosphoribosyltransferase